MKRYLKDEIFAEIFGGSLHERMHEVWRQNPFVQPNEKMVCGMQTRRELRTSKGEKKRNNIPIVKTGDNIFYESLCEK